MRRTLMTICMAGALLAGGACTNEEQPAAQLLESEGEIPSNDLVMVGDLMEVDPDLNMFRVRVVDMLEYTFSYDEDTEILGHTGQVQGLVGLTEGAEIRISYQQRGDSRHAVQIQVL